MRPVDADTIDKKIREWIGQPGDGDYYTGYDNALCAIQDFIADMPTLTPPNEPLPILVLDEPDREYIDYICPRCKSIISQRRRGQRMETMYKCKFHDNCGQRVDWSNPQPYRRPPEGEEEA